MQGCAGARRPGNQHQVRSRAHSVAWHLQCNRQLLGKSLQNSKGSHPSVGCQSPSHHPMSPYPDRRCSQVEWRKADALLPETYTDILPKVGAVVHTLGTLLEHGKYKSALAHGDVIGFIGAIAGRGGNPLDRGPQRCSYEAMNRDSGALFPELPSGRCSNMNLVHSIQLFESAKHSNPVHLTLGSRVSARSSTSRPKTFSDPWCPHGISRPNARQSKQ